MRKVVLNLAVSLDGFIARKNDSVDWLDNLDTGTNDLGFSTFLDRIDTLIMGRKSYDVTLKLGNGVWPFENKKSLVFTRQQIADKKNIIFTNEDPIITIKNLRKQEGKDIWLFGGGSFIKMMKEADLIDEYIITTIPIFIGNGIKLFEEVEKETTLELVSVEQVNSIVQTTYTVKRG